jgi:ATP-dependent Clp protease protease subunit
MTPNPQGFVPFLDDDDVPASKPNPEGGFMERKLLEARVVLVFGAVSDRLSQYCASRLLILEQMDPERPITVMINSPGGSADSGFAIYDMLRFIKPPVRTVVNGLCASAAILVQLAAEKHNRFTLPESRFLLHQPSTMGRGTASDLDITAREIIKLRERYNRIVASASGQEVERILADTKRDFWLTATEAVNYGLAARVVTRADEIDN